MTERAPKRPETFAVEGPPGEKGYYAVLPLTFGRARIIATDGLNVWSGW